MSIPVYINGLLPDTRDIRETKAGDQGGSLVRLQIEKTGLSNIRKIGYSNSEGVFDCLIPTDYIGAKITIQLVHRWYINKVYEDVIPDYGYFLTATLAHDFTYWSSSPSPDPKWDSDAEYTKAFQKLRPKIRYQRNKTRGLKTFYYLVVFGAPVLGFFLVAGWGILLGLGVAALAEVFNPYAFGLKSIKTKIKQLK